MARATVAQAADDEDAARGAAPPRQVKRGQTLDPGSTADSPGAICRAAMNKTGEDDCASSPPASGATMNSNND